MCVRVYVCMRTSIDVVTKRQHDSRYSDEASNDGDSTNDTKYHIERISTMGEKTGVFNCSLYRNTNTNNIKKPTTSLTIVNPI